MNYPQIGQVVEIHSYKHNAKIHRVWHATTILDVSHKTITAITHKTLVTEADGRVWHTKEPAIWYFYEKYWFNVLCMLRADGVYYYCNLSSPYVYDQKVIKYVDYDLDIKIFPDYSYKILDLEEYKKHKRDMKYSAEIQEVIDQQLNVLLKMLATRTGPFAPGFANYWYRVYKSQRGKR